MEFPKDIDLTEQEKKLVVPDGATTVSYGFQGLNWKGRIGFFFEMRKHKKELDRFYSEALRTKTCYYGPFVGEFGHFLLHNLPFLVHLYNQGVQIQYCGMELHKPFLVNEKGEDIIHKWYPLRDFFAEEKPNANQTELPEDVADKVALFEADALHSKMPYLNIRNRNLYWYVFRNWQLNGKQDKFDLSQVYHQSKARSCVIFPRKKGGVFSANNGGPWDYGEIARSMSPFFDKVYLVGHPSLSSDVETSGNIELKVSADNSETLHYCADASLIITQHSGAVHLGAYVNTPVLIIFNGAPPIKGLIDTIRFRKNLSNTRLSYAFNLNEIVNFAREGQ